MRQGMDETQLPVLHAEEVGIRRSAAASSIAGAERTEGHYGSNRLIDYEVPVRDVNAARHADLAGIIRSALAGVHTAFRAVAGETPRHQIHFPFQECIQVGVRGGYQRRAAV